MNGALEVETLKAAHELLETTLGIEKEAHRMERYTLCHPRLIVTPTVSMDTKTGAQGFFTVISTSFNLENVSRSLWQAVLFFVYMM